MRILRSARNFFLHCYGYWQASVQKQRDRRLTRDIMRREREMEKALRKNGMSMLLSPDYLSLATQQAFAESRLNQRR
jgi:hypothetical protein